MDNIWMIDLIKSFNLYSFYPDDYLFLNQNNISPINLSETYLSDERTHMITCWYLYWYSISGIFYCIDAFSDVLFSFECPYCCFPNDLPSPFLPILKNQFSFFHISRINRSLRIIRVSKIRSKFSLTWESVLREVNFFVYSKKPMVQYSSQSISHAEIRRNYPSFLTFW